MTKRFLTSMALAGIALTLSLPAFPADELSLAQTTDAVTTNVAIAVDDVAADWYVEGDECQYICRYYPCCPPNEVEGGGLAFAFGQASGSSPCALTSSAD